jgi:hypothetical protein
MKVEDMFTKGIKISIPWSKVLYEKLTVIIIILLFTLTANGFLPGGSRTTIKYNTQITHITQNNTTIKGNIAHKSTHTIHTLHKMNKLSLEHNNHYHHYVT